MVTKKITKKSKSKTKFTTTKNKKSKSNNTHRGVVTVPDEKLKKIYYETIKENFEKLKKGFYKNETKDIRPGYIIKYQENKENIKEINEIKS